MKFWKLLRGLPELSQPIEKKQFFQIRGCLRKRFFTFYLNSLFSFVSDILILLNIAGFIFQL
jgi:hypothetical protein